jgi:hypothetical protein
MSTYNLLNEHKMLGVNHALYAADDGDVALQVRYVGSEASATVTVDSSGDITFQHGDAAEEEVDTTVVASTGKIDTSGAAGDTFGEIVDVINASANWEARLIGSLRADASDDALLERSETTITASGNSEGIPLYKDTSEALNLGIAIGPYALESKKSTNGVWLSDTTIERYKSEIALITHKNTYATGTSVINVYDIDPINKVEILIFSYACAATTVEATKDLIGAAIESLDVGHHLLVKMVGSAACTGYLGVVGRTWQFI